MNDYAVNPPDVQILLIVSGMVYLARLQQIRDNLPAHYYDARGFHSKLIRAHENRVYARIAALSGGRTLRF